MPPSFRKQRNDFLIRRLAEVVIETADGGEDVGGPQACQFVDLGAERTGRLRRCDRHREDDSPGRCPAQRLDAGPDRRAGGDPVVDDDDDTIGRLQRGSASPVQRLSAPDLLELSLDLLLQELLPHAERGDDALVEDALRMLTVGDGAEPPSMVRLPMALITGTAPRSA